MWILFKQERQELCPHISRYETAVEQWHVHVLISFSTHGNERLIYHTLTNFIKSGTLVRCANYLSPERVMFVSRQLFVCMGPHVIIFQPHSSIASHYHQPQLVKWEQVSNLLEKG